MKVDRNPAMYTCGGNKNNFRYPYCYGDFKYATKVNEKQNLLKNFFEMYIALLNKLQNEI